MSFLGHLALVLVRTREGRHHSVVDREGAREGGQ